MMSCCGCTPPVSVSIKCYGSGNATDLDGTRKAAVCSSCQNIQGRKKVVIPKSAWISNVGALIVQIFLTLRGRGSLSRNLAHKQRLEIVGFDPLRML
jgi:hypothetical protein